MIKNKLYTRFRVSKNFLELKNTDVVLSVGCKRAELETNILDEVASVSAFDVDRKIIDECNKKFQGIKFEYGDIVKGTGYNSDYFDKIIFLEVLEHLPAGKEEEALREIFRLLKPGGVLVLSTPNDFFLTKYLDPSFWLIRHRHYNANNLAELMKKVGFSVEEKYIGGKFLELAWIPTYSILKRLGLLKFAKSKIEKLIDIEYRRPGFQTIIIKARKND